jgi:hypothetical protein
MSNARSASPQELAVIAELAQHGAPKVGAADTLRDLQVRPMSDGGMGSLLLLPRGCPEAGRVLGETIASAEFIDIDGVPVSVTLNSDRHGQLFELDVWKADFSPLRAWPDAVALRVVPR